MAVAAVPSSEPDGAIAAFTMADFPYVTASLAPISDDAAESAPEPAVLEAAVGDLVQLLRAGTAGQGGMSARPRFATDYRLLRRLAALVDLPRLRESPAVTGIASTYNPYRDGPTEGGPMTASGEMYDPAGWTAAIQTELRGQFGGVRYGRLYQPAYVLVECGERQAIVKINDVGPLKPGRVIDLNERAMRYFDPFLRRGLLPDVRVTLLPGEDWTAGPIGGAAVIRTAGNL